MLTETILFRPSLDARDDYIHKHGETIINTSLAIQYNARLSLGIFSLFTAMLFALLGEGY